MSDTESTRLLKKSSFEEETTIETPLIATSGKTSLVPLEESPHGRHLGLYSTIILFISRMVGSGIFATPGLVFKEMQGSTILFLITWVVGGIVTYSGLAVYLELGSLIPRSGGTKIFLEFIFPNPKFFWSIIFGTFSIFFNFCSTNSIIFAEYLRFSLDYPNDEYQTKKLAILLIISGFFVHSYSKKFGIYCQNIVGSLKLLTLILMILINLYILLIPSSISHIEKLPLREVFKFNKNEILKINDIPLPVIVSALLKTIYSFSGWISAHNVQNEIKNPIKTLKYGANISYLSIFVLYIIMNLTYLIIIPHKDILNSGELIGAILFKIIFGKNIGQRLLSLIISLSAASNVLVVIFADSRLNQEIAREGFLFGHKLISRNYRPFNTPILAILLHCTISIMVILIPSKGEIYNFIVSMQIYPNQIFNVVICLGIIKIRNKFKKIKAPIRIMTFLIYLCLVSSLGIIVSPLIEILINKNGNGDDNGEYGYIIGGLLVITIGIIYWAIFVKLLPYIGKYKIVRKRIVLEDGLEIKVWNKKHL
ncbi:amino acid transporter [Ascoidea rubescens DSM 1968]|uniref:Amino acid transporter n=1 Tax=Ascoidea rubescens DSM 1968 TaxID=1344418 RepID=A0A1D2VCB8_9ASCO|nr:amino acid transporter [Ascoidea rubescens DSM 1968]ODV59276.1 amino acid transporter [Ascoidea rubescens DSM 1968]